ncbi:TPA: phage head morphogenesis protein, partial [Streptococcus suis]|nr:phage head morphogenesis protein [Streptococcus suis]
PVTGKTIQVPANMTYKDWYEKYVKPKYKADNLDIWKIERANNQYEKYKSILGDKAPKSLEDYIDLKYNDKEGYERLKDWSYIQSKFNDGTWLDKINPEKQARHIQSTAGKNKSYFHDDVDVNALYDKYKMTGNIRNRETGRTGNELIDIPADLKLGKDIYTGKYINGFTIKYGKTGSHLIPTYHEE